MTVYFCHRQAKTRHGLLTMTIGKNIMYPTSYICWTEISHHRLIFVFVMESLEAHSAQARPDSV